ncbi:L-type lectin-domain containing receptor kinase VIII.2 [Linum grandiflorum]
MAILILALLFSHFNLLLADPTTTPSSFSFPKFDKDPNFDSTISLYGDAKLVQETHQASSSIQLTHSVSSTGGRVMYKKPIKLLLHNNDSSASFSTYFSFLMSPDNGDGLALFLVPAAEFNATLFLTNTPFGLSLRSPGKNRSTVVAVEYGSLKDAKNPDLNDNHVGIDVGGFVSAKVKNVSSVNTLLKSGVRLHSWVDYEAGSKRLEVRLSQRVEKPVDPLLSYPIDLSKMWNDEEVLVGLSSSNGNSSQNCILYSWSFHLRRFPKWMHSQPLDPKGFGSNDLMKPVVVVSRNRKSDCVVWVIAALVVGIGFGGLGALMVMNLCGMFGKRSAVAAEGRSGSVHPVEFDYEKVKVMVVLDDKVLKDGKQ